MLYLFIGDDVVRAKAEAAKRAKGREVVRFGEGGEPFENVGGYLEQQGMFQAGVVLILDRPLESAEGKEFLIAHAKDFEEATALVIAIIPNIDPTTLKKIEKYAEIEDFELKKKTEEPGPNSFALVDALQASDKKRAWILYRQLIESGASPEEIHGALAWAARGVVLASSTKSAEEAGMKPYPYGKAKTFARKLGTSVAEKMSEELVFLYHDARAGRGTLEDLLEVYLLSRS